MSLITFGKYRGQPIDVLLNDEPYLKWCQQQQWFQERYPDLCNQKPDVSHCPLVKTATANTTTTTNKETVKQKIQRLEEENQSLLKKIESNNEEIKRLRSGTQVAAEKPVEIVVKSERIGKCLL